MAVNIKLFDDKDQEITVVQGIDYGLARVNYPYVKQVYIKNLGNSNAYNCSLRSDTLNNLGDVEEAEYSKQLLAKSWKSFSLDNKNFYNFLDLGKISRGSYLEGIRDIKFDLTSSLGTLKETWTNAKPTFIDNKLIFRKTTYDSDDKKQGTGSGRYLVNVGNIRDVDITFYLNYIGDSKTSYAAIATLLIPIRIGSDGFGYGLAVQRNRENGKMFVAIYKRIKGMLDANTSIMGTRIADIKSYIEVDESKPLRFKCYNNSEGFPTFEFYCNDKQMTLYSSSDRSKFGMTYIDNGEGYYPSRGSMYLDIALYKGDIEFSVYGISLVTENAKQPVYIKTTVGKEAIDQEEYKSCIKLEWTE